MKNLKNILCISLAMIASLLLTACNVNLILPPLFTSTLHIYAVDNGSNVPFTSTIYYTPTSVSCFGGNVVMTNSGTNQWSGTANYSSDLLNHASGQNSGLNTVTCTASNANGTSTSTLGVIELIPNVAPNLLITQPLAICGNDGTRQYNDTLIDPSSSYLAGALYTLTAGTLPTGLSINYTSGRLIGTMAAGSQTITGLKITAVTVAGTTESAAFDINISSSPCP